MKDKLEVGDIVVVSCVLFGEREYPVTKIEGNKAFTAFRVFNTRIYPPNMIYEYGKRAESTTNRYWLKTEKPKSQTEGKKDYLLNIKI